MTRTLAIVAVLLALLAAACGGAGGATTTTTATTSPPATSGTIPSTTTTAAPASTTAAPPDEIVLMTHDSFAVSDDVLAAFADETGVQVKVLQAGDAGAMLNQAILSKDHPLADVLYGVDNTFLSRALREDLFAPYVATGLDRVDPSLVTDPEHRVTPIDFGDVCLNVDSGFFTDHDVPPPATLEDLTDPTYRGMLVVEDPATSSPGLAFLLATVARFPEGSAYDWQAYWQDLVANDVAVTSGWEEAYYGTFSGGSGGGDRPIVVSYASSPPAEVYYGELTEAPTAVVTDGCFRQIEYAGILAGTRFPDLAGRLVDFMLSRRFQEDIPLNMFVFPANQDAALPDVFVRYTTIPEHPLTLDPDVIDANREAWIDAWSRIVG